MATPTDDDNADDCISGNYYGYERGGTLARRADFFKHENKGVQAMCEIMKQLQDESRAEVFAQVAAAIGMLKDHQPMEEIAKRTHLTQDELNKLAQQL